MSTKTVKVEGWRPHQAPPKSECQAMLPLIVECVFAKFHESKLPLETFACSINEIYRCCQQKINGTDGLRQQGKWNFPYRGRETWKRRMQEAAYPENGAKIVSVRAGFYRPSPRLFPVEEA